MRTEDGFDREWALAKAADIIEDIDTVDERLTDGIAVPSALGLLEGSFGRLAHAGAPPGLDRVTYLARVSALESLAGKAADEYRIDPAQGAARYAVVRQETGVLFQQLNSALGTGLRLP